MTDFDRLEKRLAAIERTVIDDDHDRTAFGEDSTCETDVERIEARLDALDSRVADLESTVQSIDGYVSQVESVNRDVERRADAAIATVDRLEPRLDALARATETKVTPEGSRSNAGHTGDDEPSERPEGATVSGTHDRTRSESTADTGRAGWRRFIAPLQDSFEDVRERMP